MGKPAARVTDVAGHGGTITLGAKKVLIGGKPAARLGDLLACPGFDGLKPHVMGNITTASGTVKIEGAFVARLGDMTGCGAAGVSGAGSPAVVGEVKKSGALQSKGPVSVMWREVSGYTNDKGAKGEIKASQVHVEGAGKLKNANVEGAIDLGTGGVEGHIGKGGFGYGAQMSGAQVSGKVSNGSETAEVRAAFYNGALSMDMLAGTDGRRTGVYCGATAQVSLFEAQADSSSTYSLPDLVPGLGDYDIKIGKTVGWSFGSAGAAGGAGAYHDAKDDRYHATGLIDIELLEGFKFGFDISVGKKTAGVGVPLTPGVIMTGCPTVFVGG